VLIIPKDLVYSGIIICIEYDYVITIKGQTMIETRSPLKEPPLRNPGQSGEEQINDLMMDKVLFWLMMPAVFVLGAMLEWYHYLFNSPPIPILFTICAIAMAGLSFYKIRGNIPLIRQYIRGRQGEIVVGQFLEDFRKDGYHVFHDIPSPNGNVDHVLVGPGGVFVIETKTNSKPVGRECRVEYDGTQVKVDGHIPDRDPVAQVKAAVSQIDQIIQRGMSKNLPIRPVLLYVRWFTTQPRGSDIWVINEKTLLKFVRSSYKKLSPEDARLAASAIEVYVRSYQGK